MFAFLRSLALLLATLAVLATGPARAAGIDPGDLAFWQAIENSKNPAEYQAYLEAYPQGRFAPLARVRAAVTPAAVGAPTNGAAPAAAGKAGAGEIAFWQAVETSHDPAEYAAYLHAYPEGRFAALARLRLAALGGGPRSDRAGAVTIESEGAGAASLGFIGDIADVAGSRGARRVLPVLGQGSLQDLSDLTRIPTVEMAIVQADALDYARAHKLYPGIGHSVTYVAKLYNEELHLLAGRDIKSLADLAHRKVDVDVAGGGTAITAGRLFRLLKIPVETVHEPAAAALADLGAGKIAALALVAPKPAALFRGLNHAQGLHFLSVPLNPAVTAAFIPSRLTGTEYPGLVAPGKPVDTVAVGAVLAVAPVEPGSARYRALSAFVDRFFTRFDQLLAPGRNAKWRDVNLAADLPGWRRFPPAAHWLQRNASVQTMSPPALEAIFARFVDDRRRASGAPPIAGQQKAALFKEFEAWEHGGLH